MQDTNYYGLAGGEDAYGAFIFNKSLRVIVNDAACLVLLRVFFRESGAWRLGLWVMVAEVAVLLPAYFFVKLSLEGPGELSSPLLSMWHRLLVNPTLMILLLAGLLLQGMRSGRAPRAPDK